MFNLKNILNLVFITISFSSCVSTPPKMVEISQNGKEATLQLSKDSRSLMSQFSAKDAENAKQQLLARKEISDSLLASIAELAVLSGKTDEAANQARILLKKDFKNMKALKTLIKVSLFNKKYNEAILIAENALSIAPRDPDILALKGLSHYYIDEVFEARDAWKKALEVNSKHVTSLMNLATLQFYNRNISVAGAAFEKVLAIQPNHLDALVGKAIILSIQGNHVEAREILLAIEQKHAKSSLVLFNLAILERDKFNNFEQSLVYIEKYMQDTQKERLSIERALAIREDLRNLVARKKSNKMSDEELRQLAQKSSQTTNYEVAAKVQESSQIATKDNKKEPMIKATPVNSKNVVEGKEDAQSLEDALK